MTNRYWDMNKEEQNHMESIGVDYDLSGCLEYNQQKDFELSDIHQVLAVITGQNDGESWYWILELNNGKFVYLTGWCDYTGWDCQSGASSIIYDDPISACGSDGELLRQVREGKNITWHEKMNSELNIKDLPKFNHYHYPDLSEFDQ